MLQCCNIFCTPDGDSFGEEEGVEVDGMLGDDTLARVDLDRAVEDALHEAECLDKTLSCGSWGR